jgi:molybdate transport system ATP-binding protein
MRRGEFDLHVDFEARTPGVVGLFGVSGSGKTTVIDAIAGLLTPEEGRIEVDGSLLFESGRVDVPAEHRRIGYVFQDARLFPHRSVLGNLRYGERRARSASLQIGFDEIVELLGLRPLLARRPSRISGGERQRVAIGRALLAQPRLLLLDEPLASIDRARRGEVLPYLERVSDRFGIPIVYVSHQFEELLRLATQLVLLDGGRVAAQGDVESVSRDPALHAVLGADAVAAVVDAVVESTSAGGDARLRLGAGTLLAAPNGAAVGERVRLELFARDVILATEPPRGLGQPNCLAGTVTRLWSESARSRLVEVDVGGARLLSRVASARAEELALASGRGVWLIVNATAPRIGGPSGPA